MSSDNTTFFYPHRTSASAYRVPTPPRIVVPPPTLNAAALPEIALSAIDREFNKVVDYESIISQNAMLEWSYERRREAQMILPYLYLGPMTVAKDEAWLRRENITCVLGIRLKGAFEGRLMVGALKKAEQLGIEHHTIDIAGPQDLIHSFPGTSAFIYNHVSQRLQATGKLGKVFVFCESGNERSAGVVAAYLMEAHEDVDHIKAMQLCQAQRFCTNFDDGMKRLLQSYWDIVCARRAVAGSVTPNFAMLPSNVRTEVATNVKRPLERDDDEDEDMDGMDSDDEERFSGRTYAPFVDYEI